MRINERFLNASLPDDFYWFNEPKRYEIGNGLEIFTDEAGNVYRLNLANGNMSKLDPPMLEGGGAGHGSVGAVHFVSPQQSAGLPDDVVEPIHLHQSERDRLDGIEAAAELAADVVAQKFVVIAGNIDDARAFTSLAQELLDDVVVFLRPVPAAPQTPSVDDIADVRQIGLGQVGMMKAQEKMTPEQKKMMGGMLGQASGSPLSEADLKVIEKHWEEIQAASKH